MAHNKDFWHAILKNDGEIPAGASLDDLTAELLDFMRSPDPELRDTFGYQLLAHYIISGAYSEDALHDFMERWLADLNTGLGESGTDTVITRSFAALMLSILVYRDMKESYLAADEIANLVDEAIDYFAAEADLRGHDAKKGWLHALAHTSDLFKFLARDNKSTAEQHLRILDTIAQKLTQKTPVILSHGEDERLAMAVMDVLKRNTLSEPQLRSWVNDLIAMKEMESGDFDPEVFGAYQNVKHFLRALYFRIAYFEGDLPGAYNLQEDLHETLKQFMN
jgi:HEPN domain-containing protein